MSRRSPFSLTLRTKFMLSIGLIVSLSYALLLYRTSLLQDELVIAQAKRQARMLYRQVLLTRQWISDHNGVFVRRQPGVEENPYLPLPSIIDTDGNRYFMRNPAMVTRELSEYSESEGYGRFRVTSLKPVNPANKPDDYERRCLISFEQGSPESISIQNLPQGRILRFIAPLNATNSCLGCHAKYGYHEGDSLGALSISVPIAWAEQIIAANNHYLLLGGAISVVVVTSVLFLMLDGLVTRRIDKLTRAMNNFPDQPLQPTLLPTGGDEISDLSSHFVDFCNRLERSQKELDKTRSQACFNEKMASLGILSAGIAHEVNNPLAGMLNCVKALSQNPQDSELTQRYLPLIDKGLKQIEHTMRQLLNFGRTEPLEKRSVDVKGLIKECIDLLSFRVKGIEIRLELDLPDHLVVDAEALKQILVNIGLNAIQAMQDRGVLTVAGSYQNATLHLIISDTGCGIGQEILPHIFDPFFTTKGVGEGTGLGLAVTYSLIRKMEGEIQVASEPDKGTSFSITIPA